MTELRNASTEDDQRTAHTAMNNLGLQAAQAFSSRKLSQQVAKKLEREIKKASGQ